VKPIASLVAFTTVGEINPQGWQPQIKEILKNQEFDFMLLIANHDERIETLRFVEFASLKLGIQRIRLH
jgi:hypothetical protein